MDPKRIPGGKKPETIIQERIVKKLKGLDWFVKELDGNAMNSGWPDIYAFHMHFGQRWIEVKNPKKYDFTPAQRIWFPKFSAVGCGIWILTDDSDDEIKKLMQPENWYRYLKGIWDVR